MRLMCLAQRHNILIQLRFQPMCSVSIDHLLSLATNLFTSGVPSITYANILLLKRGIDHVLKKFKVRRGCTVPSPLSWPSTKKFDGTEVFATTGSVDGCSILPETQFVETHLRVNTTQVLSGESSFPLWELPEKGQSFALNRL